MTHADDIWAVPEQRGVHKRRYRRQSPAVAVQLGVRHVADSYSSVLCRQKCSTHEGEYIHITSILFVRKKTAKISTNMPSKSSRTFCTFLSLILLLYLNEDSSMIAAVGVSSRQQ